MQSMNVQPHVLPMGEQFFNQNQPNDQPGMGMGMPQMFSPQMNQARMLGQQPGMMPNMQSVTNNQDMSNAYLLKQKLDPMMVQQAQLQNQQQAQQMQPQQGLQNQPQGQQQQHFNVATPLGNNMPPGLNVFQQPNVNITRPQMAKSMQTGPGANINMGPMPPIMLPPPNHLFVRDVWKNNLHSEFSLIRRLVGQYNYVSVSFEFTGTLARPIGNFRSKEDYHYQTMRANVDFLKPIQIGLSLSDANGNKPDNGISTWQFNCEFDTSTEMLSAESIDLLRKSGINFDNHKLNGIDVFEFAQLMTDSGLLLDENVTWITYHTAYDLGFLVKILMNDTMPNNRQEFEWWIHKFIPNLYDLNLLHKLIRDFKQPQAQTHQFNLTTLADEVGLPRFPIFTTTGGQSLLMLLTFCQLCKISMNKLPNGTDFANYKNVIYGIDEETTKTEGHL
ncbi:hypothetical protein KAFR_0C04830 [Kazachstania africana CBS 2517]|uniref:poly(A)-specific ribonuclease n=1 Tax=Kazachstania africana (strain ATCC 22294 / BCRC 22015 / CBS 2517 / CECT 1963 / NBRC 1671 / NRRL Y-8276) TaxID=1071382 RepID=H2ASX4_KAZAF|nr:hypothetical protein KAFR_0C04830 [Kazachstania africana CBS 2517]CCF57474.1 hypothetical protein KAFR_0C04830 [Kazachstania africana CBS 2517]